MSKLLPDGELTFHDWESCQNVMDVLLNEGYVLLLSREESLYTLNYIWTCENYADRNEVVFMDRSEFDCKYYEDPDYSEDEDYEKWAEIRRQERESTEREVWYYAKALLDASPALIEKVFGVDGMSEPEQDTFWQMFPENISYEYARQKINEYRDRQDATLGERVMEEAFRSWDRANAERWEEAKKEEAEDQEQPWTDRYPDALNDTYPEP